MGSGRRHKARRSRRARRCPIRWQVLWKRAMSTRAPSASWMTRPARTRRAGVARAAHPRAGRRQRRGLLPGAARARCGRDRRRRRAGGVAAVCADRRPSRRWRARTATKRDACSTCSRASMRMRRRCRGCAMVCDVAQERADQGGGGVSLKPHRCATPSASPARAAAPGGHAHAAPAHAPGRAGSRASGRRRRPSHLRLRSRRRRPWWRRRLQRRGAGAAAPAQRCGATLPACARAIAASRAACRSPSPSRPTARSATCAPLSAQPEGVFEAGGAGGGGALALRGHRSARQHHAHADVPPAAEPNELIGWPCRAQRRQCRHDFHRLRLLETVEHETAPSPTWTVLWLHGLGADGNDFAPIVPELVRRDWPALRFVFPHAPVRAGDDQQRHAHARLVRHRQSTSTLRRQPRRRGRRGRVGGAGRGADRARSTSAASRPSGSC